MKFNFRLDTLMRHRKLLRDEAQREFQDAQNAVQKQLALIKSMYQELDNARFGAEKIQKQGGSCLPQLVQIEEYIEGQKIRIQQARQKARELLQVAEQKQEILIEKMQEHKVLEKLKEKQAASHRKEVSKRERINSDDMVLMRHGHKERV